MQAIDFLRFVAAFVATAMACCTGVSVQAGDRPNILWITSEDNSARWLGCYGNKLAHTPRLDGLAEEGIVYQYAYSNGPVCAVARSTLLTGMYATAIGTQHMRSRYRIPDRFLPYVSHLRDGGYYCTNNSKTDYNFKGVDESWWDESSEDAHYRNRPEGVPFFSVFNLTTTHESSLFEEKTESYRKNRVIAAQTRLAAEDVQVPPLYPDLPEIRRDIATYHDVVTAMDDQVGDILDDLSSAGLADDTIVFYYSDHGGILPRSKRYVYDSGTRVPLLIRIPERFRSTVTPTAGTRVEEPVAFVDFAPTVLSIAGLNIPSHYQGRAFLGSQRHDREANQFVFLYGDRFDETIRMHRAITDGRYRYVHNFCPHLIAALENEYPYGIASWRAWRDAAERGNLASQHLQLWASPQPSCELYDLQNDPWEVHDLVLTNTAPGRTSVMRQALRRIMLDTRDLGVVPEAIWSDLAGEAPLYDYVRSAAFPWKEVIDLAFLASDQDSVNLSVFVQKLSSENPVVRYWSAVGCLELGPAMASRTAELETLLDDEYAVNRITAAHALYRLDASPRYLEIVAKEALHTANDAAATLAFHTLYQLDGTDAVPTSSLEKVMREAPQSYAARWAKRYLIERH